MALSACSTSTTGHADMGDYSHAQTGDAPICVSRRRFLSLTASAAATTAMGLTWGSASAPASAAHAAAPAACSVPPREPLPFAAPDPQTVWSAPSGALATQIRGTDARYRYSVGGQPEIIRGMGYNPRLDGLSPDDRRVRLAQDMLLMATANVNTLIGWNPAVLDGLALDVAWQAGLGVALPFDVDFTADVRSPSVRAEFLAAIQVWVQQYQQHPALRMWAVGNEVLQRAVPPSWCSTPPTAEQASWADTWSGLLVEAADLIHMLDPQHPVLYREAEDAYSPWLARALGERPADRPWLVYGVNAYTSRLPEILASWLDRGIPTSLLVSEYAPLNAPRGGRASGLREQWAAIRVYGDYVLGGAVYVWSTDGPEAVDQQFGLVDASGRPVDNALETVAELYRADALASRVAS